MSEKVVFMSRPKKEKKVNCSFEGKMFSFKNADYETLITLESDAYETFRLIDYLGYNQLEASKEIGVSRTTVQALYKHAREQIAKAMFENKILHIIGGKHIMSQESNCCQESKSMTKIAVMLKDGKITDLYEHADGFMLYTLKQGEMKRKDLIKPQDEKPHMCRNFLSSLGVEHVITGPMTKHTYEKYRESNMHVYMSEGDSDKAALAYINQQLKTMDLYTLEDQDSCCHSKKTHTCKD